MLLAGTLALAVWLRIKGLSFGLPAVYNPDELAILSRALAFAQGDLNPHNFLYPSFFFYVLFAWIGAFFTLGWLTGAISSLGAFQTQFFVDPTSIYLAARTLDVVCGVASVWAVWWLARRLFGTGVAHVSALFLAVAPTAVRDAHYIKHDVPATLALVVAMIGVSRVWPCSRSHPEIAAGETARRGSAPATRWEVILAGAACGVAFSTHYYTVFLVAPLIIAVWISTRAMERRRRLQTLASAGVAAALVFVALSPFLLAEPTAAWRDITANQQIVVERAGAGQGRLFPSAATYARMLWTEATGWPIVLAALWGIWLLGGLSRRMAVWFLSFPLLFMLFISNTVSASRYLNPILPFIVIAAALGVNDLAVRLFPRSRTIAVAVLALAIAGPGIVQSRWIGHFFQQTDTRTLAQRLIEQQVPAGRTVLLQPYSVQLVQSRESLVESLQARIGDPARASTKFALRLQLDPWPSPAYRTLYLGEGGLDADKIYLSYGDFAGNRGPEVLTRFGIDYVVLKRFPGDETAIDNLRKLLEQRATLIGRIAPYRPGASVAAQMTVQPFLHNTDTPLDAALERPGPIMEIWAVR